jgi:hypothetical protein
MELLIVPRTIKSNHSSLGDHTDLCAIECRPAVGGFILSQERIFHLSLACNPSDNVRKLQIE